LDTSAFHSHHNYILIFKEHFADGRSICTCLDPTNIGNVGRFINHSCGPNLIAYAIRVGGNPHPRVALFAGRDINVGEELAFSYQESSWMRDDQSDLKPCFCGHTACKKWYGQYR
jgi:histone-lysine N-methyltransferase SETMAR